MAVPENRATGHQQACVAGEVSGRQAGIQGAKQTASDEQLPVCRVCERTGEINYANTFCVECNDHMCGNCARVHRGSRTSSRHQLLDKSQMPRKAFKARNMCDTHPDTPIEYHCKKQDQLLCRCCITLYHQDCQEDDLISNVCGHIGDSREFNKMHTCLKQIKENITKHETKLKDELADIDSNQHKVRCDIDTIKEELHMLVDRLVDDAYDEVECLVDIDKETLAAVSEECDKVAAEVNSLITEIDIKKQSKVDMQLFITMKAAQQAIELLGFKMQSIDSQNFIRQYNFKPDKQLLKVMGSVAKLGLLSVEAEGNVQSASAGCVVTKRPNGKPGRTVASKTDELAIQDKRDKSDCSITGIELVDDDRIAIVDHSNSSVKMISLSHKSVTHQLQLRYQPWDITKINTDTLAVTCPPGQCIQMVSVPRSGSLSRGRKIKVQGVCHGIQYSSTGGGRMVVSFVDKGVHNVQIIDMSGTLLKDVSCNSAGTSLFTWPKYVALSPDGHCVYVSDCSSDTVTGITLDGRVVFIYRDAKLKSPTGLSVTDDGVIYVCSSWSNLIHMVSSKGKKIKVLLRKEIGTMTPQCIMYQRSEPRLYVGMGNVHVFTLTQGQ